MSEGTAGTDLAIVGLGLHVPGATGPHTFWAMLHDGRSAIRRLPREELIGNGEAAPLVDRPDYVPFAADLAHPFRFDAAFWGLSPKDATVMDPQHRHFLQASWEALEDAGIVPERFAGRIGVFAGCGQGTWYHRHVLSNPDLVDGTGTFLLRHTGNDKDFLATRLSHALDLRGPSVNVQTACSTSLVATHMAAQALLNGECDAALAGGVTVELPHAVGYLFRENEILSPDGQCHAFDHRAAGTVFGSGAAVAVLRRLDDALRDGDAIWAVLKGSAINNDGARKAGYLAPSVDGQAEAIREAQGVAGVAPETISYVECHGTGTALGDPIEVAALREAFGDAPRPGSILIGSVKTNIGHLDTAAGTVALAKAALALHHGTVPPSLGYEAPNPAIPFEGSPFRVADRLQPFPEAPGGGPRRAAVNSLGVGGTNAHAILEEAPERAPSEEPAFPFQLLTLSARSRTALDAASLNLAAHLRAHPEQPLADVAWTLQEGRRAFPHRRVVVASGHEEAAALLESLDRRRVFTHEVVGEAPEMVFMLPGGGAQHVAMGRGLYDTEPVFRDWMDRGLTILHRLSGEDGRNVWLPDPGREKEAAQRLLQPSVQLPLLMILEFALAKLWMSWGVAPSILIGHSMGENTAAALAGVMSFEDAVGLVHLRGRLFDTLPTGAMISVALPADELRPHLGDLDLAVVNAPSLSVASGPAAEVEALAARLAALGIEAQTIPIAVAAHSRMLEPILAPFGDYLRSIPLWAPVIPIVSNVTGRRLTDAEATSPEYWVRHLRGTILFADGLGTLAAENPRRIYLEVGPGRALSSLAGQHPLIGANQVVSSLRHRDEAVADDLHFQTMLGRIWACGSGLDWDQVWGGARRNRVRLPTYPWEGQDFFIAPGTRAAPEAGLPVRTGEVSDWAWAPRWTPRYAPLDGEAVDAAPQTWLIFEDEGGIGAEVRARLRAMGHVVTTVRPGDRYARLSDDTVLLPPERGQEGHELLVRDLVRTQRLPTRVLHLWLATKGEGHRPGSSFFHRTQEQGFWSILFLAQAWGAEAGEAPLHLVVASTGALQVRDEVLPHPAKATVLGPLQVLPREFPRSTATLLDLDPSLPCKALADALLEEGLAEPGNVVASLRGGRRLERSWGPMPLPEARPEASPVLRGGPVLITGGFGGIGLAVAERLAREAGAPLALLSRRPLPPRAEWDWVLGREGGVVADRIRAVRRLEALGVRVVALAADVANLEEMRAAVTEAEATLGTLSGVVHAAGVIDDAPILGKDPAAAEDVLAPKVLGTQVLHDIFPDGRLDWLVLFSSSSTATAPGGQADYVAANAFLGAYARHRTGGRTRVLALDWGVWHGVGMAAEAVAPRDGGASGTELEGEPVALPLLDRASFDAEGRRILTASWAPEHRWALDEHRTKAGFALLPGTGVLELAAEALAAQSKAFPWTVRDLTFLRPLRTLDGNTTRVRLTLGRSGTGYDLLLESAVPGGTFEANAEAAIDMRPLLQPAPLDLAAIRERLDGRPTMLMAGPDGTLVSPQEAHLRFGPRWRTLREATLGEGEGLATLALPSTGAEGTILHPGLMDLATGWAVALIAGYDASRLWVPLSYGEVCVHAPLTPVVLSHVSLSPGGGEAASFDVTLADTEGRVLVEIRGFTMRALDGPLVFAAPAASRPPSPAEERLAHAVRQGIRVEEGTEAFLRALALPRAEVLVSSMPLPALIAQAGVADAPKATRAFGRPGDQEASAFDAPEGLLEERLAVFFQDLLGVARVGAGDSFFDLGGHSLVAVRLFAQIKRAFGVDAPISALFEAPSVRALARLVAERGGRLPDAGDEARAPSLVLVPREAPSRPRFVHLVPMGGGKSSDRPPFFLVAGMFGNVLNLRHLAHLVGADRPVWGLQAQGLTGEAEPHASMREAAASMIAEMRQVHPGGRSAPWMVGGFSGGGITAQEIAVQLQDAGEQVAAVVLLDTPLPQRRPLSARDRAAINWLELRRNGASHLLSWPGRRLAWEIEKRRGRPAEAPAEPAFHDAAIEAAFLHAAATHELRRWDGPLSLFRPPLMGAWEVAPGRWVSRERAYLTPDNDWGPLAPRLQVVEVPGDHDSMVLEPNVRVLAARLRRVLEAAERDWASCAPYREAAE